MGKFDVARENLNLDPKTVDSTRIDLAKKFGTKEKKGHSYNGAEGPIFFSHFPHRHCGCHRHHHHLYQSKFTASPSSDPDNFRWFGILIKISRSWRRRKFFLKGQLGTTAHQAARQRLELEKGAKWKVAALKQYFAFGSVTVRTEADECFNRFFLKFNLEQDSQKWGESLSELFVLPVAI